MFFCGLNRSITIKYQMYIISKLHKKIPLNNANNILKKKIPLNYPLNKNKKHTIKPDQSELAQKTTVNC